MHTCTFSLTDTEIKNSLLKEAGVQYFELYHAFIPFLVFFQTLEIMYKHMTTEIMEEVMIGALES